MQSHPSDSVNGGAVDSTRKLEAGPSEDDKNLRNPGDRSFSEEKLKDDSKSSKKANISVEDDEDQQDQKNNIISSNNNDAAYLDK